MQRLPLNWIEASLRRSYSSLDEGLADTAAGTLFAYGDARGGQVLAQRTLSGAQVLTFLEDASFAEATAGGQFAAAPVVRLTDFGTHARGLAAALQSAMRQGGTLELPPHPVAIMGWNAPFRQTGPLRISGQVGRSRLDLTGASASLIHNLHPVFEASGFGVTGLGRPTSGNGGSFIFNTVTDRIGRPVAPILRNLRFSNCTAPINIEAPFDGARIEWCEYLDGRGHGFRFGSSGGGWDRWRNLSVTGWRVRNLTAVAPGQNVYAGLAYGDGHRFDWFDVDGVFGTRSRNAREGYDAEAGGLHTQARNVIIGVNNTSKNISGAKIVRHLMIKGEADAVNCAVGFWHAECGGVGEGLAWYANSGSARFRADDPGISGCTVGTSVTRERVHITLEANGRNRPGVYGIAAPWANGDLEISGIIKNFDRPVVVAGKPGGRPGALRIDATISGGSGTAIEISLETSVPEISISGSTSAAPGRKCRTIRGKPGTTVGRLSVGGTTSCRGGDSLDISGIGVRLLARG